MSFDKRHVVTSIFAFLMFVSFTLAMEEPDITFEKPEINAGDSIDRPHNVSNFGNVSLSEDGVSVQDGSRVLDNHNFSVEELFENSEKISDQNNGTEEDKSEVEKRSNVVESSSSSSSSTVTVVDEEKTWSATSASLSHSTADYNDTVYIEGYIEGDRKRNASVFLGEERISDLGPLNGSFRIPIEAREIEGRQLRLETDFRTLDFDIDVNSQSNISEKDSEDRCINTTQQGFGLGMFRGPGMADTHNIAPCLDSSRTLVMDGTSESSNHTLTEGFTGMFSQRVMGDGWFNEINDRLGRIEHEIGLIVDYIEEDLF